MSWQVKDLLSDENTRNALLSCQTIETIFLSLKAICEVSILQCVNYDFMDVSPVLAYASLALHMTLQKGRQYIPSNSGTKNKFPDSCSSEEKLEQTLDHLLECVKKLYMSDDSPDEAKRGNGKSTRHVDQKLKESGINRSHSFQGVIHVGCVDASEKTLKQVKNLTAVLKFIVDAISMGFLSQKYELCLKFASGYMQSITLILGQQVYKDIQLEAEMKEIFLCLKSSMTYAAKLLNQILRRVEDSPLTQTSILGHNLLDLIALIEVHLGSSYASRLVAVAKPWLPDLILALGASCIMIPAKVEEVHINFLEQTKFYFPPWLSIVAKIELSNTSEDSAEEEEDDGSFNKHNSSTFKKFLKMIVTFLKRDPHILDAVGLVFMVGSEVGLERKDFGLVLGLLQFVCQSLYSADDREWGDMMLASLQRCYPQIEREIEQCNGDGRYQLDKAKTLLEPIWLYHIFETGKLSMMNE